MLISRVANTDHSWHKEWTAPRVSPHFDLTLDDKSVLRAIDQLNFIQMKREYNILYDFAAIISNLVHSVSLLREFDISTTIYHVRVLNPYKFRTRLSCNLRILLRLQWYDFNKSFNHQWNNCEYCSSLSRSLLKYSITCICER